MKKWIIASCLMFATTPLAQAKVLLKDVIVQQGYFVDQTEACKQSEPSDIWDMCGCEADMRYPQVSGGINHPLIESRVNTRLQFLAPKQLCDGVETTVPESERNPSTRNSQYEIKTNDSRYLSVVQTTDSYPAGAAHGMSVKDAVTLQMPDGKPLSLGLILDENKTAELNSYLYEEIIKRAYDGELDAASYWGEALASKKSSFIKRNSCEECVFHVDDEGVKLTFQLYSVAPYAAGFIEIPVPAEFIGDAALKTYLEGQSNAAR